MKKKSETTQLKIGEKIRGLREKQNITKAQLAKSSSLSQTLISQIENEIITPTVAALLKISRALKIDIGYFFQEEALKRRIEVVRSSERKKIERKRVQGQSPLSYSYESLSHRIIDKHMQPFLVEFDINIHEELPPLSHDGEEFLYLLNGNLEFKSDKEVITLSAGDTIYFDSKIPHSFYGKGKTKPRAIVVVFASKD